MFGNRGLVDNRKIYFDFNFFSISSPVLPSIIFNWKWTQGIVHFLDRWINFYLSSFWSDFLHINLLLIYGRHSLQFNIDMRKWDFLMKRKKEKKFWFDRRWKDRDIKTHLAGKRNFGGFRKNRIFQINLVCKKCNQNF